MKPSPGALLLLAYLTLGLESGEASNKTPAPPTLQSFDTYEDMQLYFAERSSRGLRHLDNPTDDSYVSAFNYHNEQPARGARPKRSDPSKMLPTEPQLLMFDVKDAVEPNEEVKQLIRAGRMREMRQQADGHPPAKPQQSQQQGHKDTPTVKKNTGHKKGRRSKRSTKSFNEKSVRMIRFDHEDAREPDEHMKAHFKRLRESLDMDQSHQSPSTTESTIQTIASKVQPKGRVSAKRKRPRRSAPQMIKFELEDARDPGESLKSLMKQKQAKREGHSMSVERPQNQSEPLKASTKESSPSSSSSPASSEISRSDDQANNESKRLYVYKEMPMKVKKSINTLPHEVQKIISNIMKDNHGGGGGAGGGSGGGGKAYLKHLPQQQINYGYLKAGYQLKGGYGQQPVYGAKLVMPSTAATYLKYVQPQQQVEPVHIQAVPVVEKVRYVYHPVAVSSLAPHQTHAALQQHHQHQQQQQQYVEAPAEQATAAHLGSMTHPIVVPEIHQQQQQQLQHEQRQQQLQHEQQQQQLHHQQQLQHQQHQQQLQQQQQHQQPIETHHTYVADLSNVHQAASNEDQLQGIKEIAVPVSRFRPSKPDPLQQHAEPGNHLDNAAEYGGLSKGYASEVPVEHYKYELFSPNEAAGQAKANLQAETGGHAYPAAGGGGGGGGALKQSPVIKIEYHTPADRAKQDYKDLSEFKELSALMGKSPEDQIHGLTYLLAKEMQTKLNARRQQKSLGGGGGDQGLMHRPQDSTSPILFHPGGGKDYQLMPNDFKTHSGTLIGMGKSKLYVPIVEKTHMAVAEAGGGGGGGKNLENAAVKAEAALPTPTPTSYVEYNKAEQHNGKKVVVEQVIHHPTVTHHGLAQPYAQGAEPHLKFAHGLHYPEDDTYASKYAFGYRIRDFHTGNDFGHKQNRDLDGVTRGQYHILLPDGRIQNVIYHADDTGFHADVSFESGH